MSLKNKVGNVPLIDTSPETSNLVEGLLVPIPTLPDESMRTDSVSPVSIQCSPMTVKI